MYTFLVSCNCGPVNLHFEILSGVNLQRLKNGITKDVVAFPAVKLTLASGL